MNSIHITRSDLLAKKGRIVPPLFHADSLPNKQIERLNPRLSDILAQMNDSILTGDNENEDSHRQ